MISLLTNVHCFFPKTKHFQVCECGKNTQEIIVVEFVTHGVREARVLNRTKLLDNLNCVTSWVSFHNSNLPRGWVGLVENLARIILPKEF
jgi:hypothetical protein